MFLQQEKPEMDDFERKQILVLKEKFFFNISKEYFEKCPSFKGYPCKNITTYFCIFFCFRTF